MRASLRPGHAARLGLALAFALVQPGSARAQVGDVSPVPLDAFARGVEQQSLEARAGALAPAPRLVVALLVDQFRDQDLDRFRSVYGKDGFRRLIDGGARFRDCTIPYAATLTGPGHATWLSGANPASHGIVGNDWFDPAMGRMVGAAEDASVLSVGLPPGVRGEPASPRWMKAQTVADVLRERTSGAARVVGISDKARSAILPSGHHPTGAYWLDGESGLMQTSTWYAAALPAWAATQNVERRKAIDRARREPWERALPDAAYLGTVIADPRDVFPHTVAAGENGGPSEIDLGAHPVSLATL
ncbi:MAG: alkaline phosphatase family protein, partial [Candidatus Eisenbacteria bacterium]